MHSSAKTFPPIGIQWTWRIENPLDATRPIQFSPVKSKSRGTAFKVESLWITYGIKQRRKRPERAGQSVFGRHGVCTNFKFNNNANSGFVASGPNAENLILARVHVSGYLGNIDR